MNALTYRQSSPTWRTKTSPLFATFDQIRRMLEADLNISFSRQEVLRRRKGNVSGTSSRSAEVRSPMETMFLGNREGETLEGSRTNLVNFE